MATTKETAKQLIDNLSDKATWDDIMYEFYVKQKIDAGMQAIEEGHTHSHKDVKRRLLGGN